MTTATGVKDRKHSENTTFGSSVRNFFFNHLNMIIISFQFAPGKSYESLTDSGWKSNCLRSCFLKYEHLWMKFTLNEELGAQFLLKSGPSYWMFLKQQWLTLKKASIILWTYLQSSEQHKNSLPSTCCLAILDCYHNSLGSSGYTSGTQPSSSADWISGVGLVCRLDPVQSQCMKLVHGYDPTMCPPNPVYWIQL